MVRMPISRRTGAAYFMAGWKCWANRKPTPMLSMQVCTNAGGTARLMPNSSNTSAEPDLLVTERLPCLATATPAPATTKAAAVEILKVFSLSPPVPQVSMMCAAAWGDTYGQVAHDAGKPGNLFDALAFHA